jgi:hypothetical protein
MSNINDFLRNLSNEDKISVKQIGTSTSNIKETDRWTGKIINNDDPMKLGRCKIRIFGFYDELPESNLPWALPESSYTGSTYGTLTVPEIGTIVRGYFDVGDVQKPIYTAVAATIGALTGTSTKFQRITEYPHTMVLFETDQGDSLTLNRLNGETKFFHRSGFNISISKDGSISISSMVASDTTPNMSVNMVGNINLNTKGNVDVISEGDININAVKGAVNLGNNPAKQLVCTQPVCFVTGAPLNGNNINVKA